MYHTALKYGRIRQSATTQEHWVKLVSNDRLEVNCNSSGYELFNKRYDTVELQLCFG